jgi:hypothetical protein
MVDLGGRFRGLEVQGFKVERSQGGGEFIVVG